VRLTFAFPFLAVISLLISYYPWISPWMEIFVAFAESYLICALFAINVGIAFIKTKGHFPDTILKSAWTRSKFRFCGTHFATGNDALTFWKYSVIQVGVVVPLVQIINAIVVLSLNISALPTGWGILLSFFRVVSLFWSVISLLRVTMACMEAPGCPLDGHNSILKITLIKAIFLLIVVNSLIISPLVEANIIAVDEWICSPQAETINSGYCKKRLLEIIFLSEVAMLAVPAAFLFHHSEFDSRHLLDKESYSSLLAEFFCLIVCVHDLPQFWSGEMTTWTNSNDYLNQEEHLLQDGEEE